MPVMLVMAGIFITPAYAQSAGDACSSTKFSSPIWVGGAAGGAGSYLVCDGSNWVRSIEHDTDGNVGIKHASPAAPLHVGGAVIIGASSLTCSATTEGAIRYNTTGKNIEVCNGSDWAQISGGSGAIGIGSVRGDGSVYAGESGGADIYVTRCDVGQTWNGSACTGTRSTPYWNNGNSSNYTTTGVVDAQDGQANTASLVTKDSDSGTSGVQPHQVAQYCHDLVLHGHSDWYLPAPNEMFMVYENRVAIGNFDVVKQYWTSSEHNFMHAKIMRFEYGDLGGIDKRNVNVVRCARR